MEIPSPEERFPQKGTVLIFPGGGYRYLSDREAAPIVRAFSGYEIRSGIFRYDVDSRLLGARPVTQAAWAVAKIRELYPGEPVTVLGFSAGAHCAGSLGVHYDGIDWNGKDLFAETDFAGRNVRPDGMVLCYPVITAGEYAHKGSIERLIGALEDPEEYARAAGWMSLETQVTENTPQAFIWQTQEDNSVPVQNSLLMVQSLVKAHVPTELHMYPRGLHGMSLATKETEDPEDGLMPDAHVAGWFEEMVQWLRVSRLVAQA